MIRGLIALLVLLMIFAAKASYQGRVMAVVFAIAVIFFVIKNKNKI